MKLVIEIPEEIQLALINNIQLSMDQQSICDSYIKHAIVNGKPLPKGHGNLVDADYITQDLETFEKSFYIYDHVLKPKTTIICEAPVIVEADKEEYK